jgi:(S)-ureidoglycine aminohydrolase
MALVDLGEGGMAGPAAQGCGRAFYVVSGTVTLRTTAGRDDLGPGGFAHIPAGADHALTSGGGARICVIDKPHVALAGAAPGRPVVGDASRITPHDFLGDPRVRVTQLLPDDPALDLALNIMTFDPGASLPFVETHVMEHGLLMLEGSMVYRLGDAWYPVAAGDAIWMGPFCPQWCCAYGTGPAAYLIYKDWNRDAMA